MKCFSIILLQLEFYFPLTPNCQSAWFSQSSETSLKLNICYFLNSNTGIVVGGDFTYLTNGVLLRTSNGGQNWENINYSSSNRLYNISFINDLTGFISGSEKIFKTTNSGLNWTIINPQQILEIRGIKFFDQNTGIITGSFNKNYYIYKTTNGGINWMQTYFSSGGSSIPKPTEIFFLDSNKGFVANGSLYMTINAGLNWNRLLFGGGRAVSFLNSNTGFTVGGESGTRKMSKTTNSGINWIENYSNGAAFNDIVFTNAESGFIVGDSATILHSLDAGKNWINLNSPVPRTKSINNIFFINKDTGYAVGDSRLIIKTITGGITSINSSNENIPQSFSLNQNYPNPFNPNTIINYQLSMFNYVSLKVYDVLGNEISTLVQGKQNAGSYSVEWDGSNYSSGVYFYHIVIHSDKLTAGEYSDIKKMTLLK